MQSSDPNSVRQFEECPDSNFVHGMYAVCIMRFLLESNNQEPSLCITVVIASVQSEKSVCTEALLTSDGNFCTEALHTSDENR